MAYEQPEGLVDTGRLTLDGTWQQLNADNPNGYRVLWFRHQTSGTTLEWSAKGVAGAMKGGPHLKADESWTLGPNCGTLHTTEVWIKGTAGEVVKWGGILV